MDKTIDKLIDDIIELILEDVDCHHEVDHDEDGVHTSVEYSLNDETKLRGMIGESIEKAIIKIDEECVKSYKTGYKAGVIDEMKPEVTKEWIEEKAEVVCETVRLHPRLTMEIAKGFIRLLVEEIVHKKVNIKEK